MTDHLKDAAAGAGIGAGATAAVDCATDPVGSLVDMFVNIVQGGRIAKGQCPALRPVFLKPHGVAAGRFRIRPDLPEDLKVGLFAGTEYPAWVRFSSDTLPTVSDYKTTLGIGIKLFDTPIPKIFGAPTETTFDIILQNFDVFFVNTARDMCEFTRAGVIDGDYGPYLEAHPETARLLDEMAKPVASCLGSDYWSGVPFAYGPGRFVKYKLEAAIDADPLPDRPADPTYLAADLDARLRAGAVSFRFMVQFQTDPALMPLDEATVRWDEALSPPVHVADLILPAQDITIRGQPAYGENLSMNIWRVTADHTPQGSIAEARRDVYAASADQRRNANGVALGEPSVPRPLVQVAPAVDSVVVRAAIHPGIGVARIGDAAEAWYIGPEVVGPVPEAPGFYRDETGAIKRQAAQFRIYGYNAAGQVVRELTAENADITWTVHPANKKAAWYQFQAALDIPDAATMTVPRRNPDVPFADRGSLVIDPGPRSISGVSVSGGPEHSFDTGKFKDVVVPLGEIRTDAAGRLIFLGGRGVSASPSGAPVYRPEDPNSFNNANDWYDDISDGPVTAAVTIDGRPLPVDPAWVVVAPPNYAPDIISWRTLHDLLTDMYIDDGRLPMPEVISFSRDVLPVLSRLSNLQWVNKGFAAMFGKGGPLDFDDPALIDRLAQVPGDDGQDPWIELRQVVFNAFRPADTPVNEQRLWPWLYGDAFGSFSKASPGNNLPLSRVREAILRRWVEGHFVDDRAEAGPPPATIAQVPLADQPAMLDKAALHYCLADAFHPGCEMTWPMRHGTMYMSLYRLRHRPAGAVEPDYGKTLDQQIALAPGGPVYDQGPGDISRWMALPWQGDTAFCRSGYDLAYDPYLPSFWPARVPNQVLTEEVYELVTNPDMPRDQRVAAFQTRAGWLRALTGSVAEVMDEMIADFGAMGIVEARPGVDGDPDLPAVMYVETLAGGRLKQAAEQVARLRSAAGPRTLSRAERAGWASEAQMAAFRSIRVRHTDE